MAFGLQPGRKHPVGCERRSIMLEYMTSGFGGTTRISETSVSVIICTRDRSDSLRQTLAALENVTVPEGWEVEIIVVDNGSTDGTPEVARKAPQRNFRLVYILEPRKGKGFALNTGVAAANGNALLFIDDDVRPTKDWLQRIAAPLLNKECDAVAGRIELAPYLERSWMTRPHKLWLAARDGPLYGEVVLVGANMGFHRSVLSRVPAFDPELGPPPLGCGEDTLFSLQLTQAGFRLRFVSEASVVHHLESSRLLRARWLAAARSHGQSMAYVLHHWHHGELRAPFIRRVYLMSKLCLRRILQPPPPMDGEGCPFWEMCYVRDAEMCRRFLKERQRPRNYSYRGQLYLGMRPNAERTATPCASAT